MNIKSETHDMNAHKRQFVIGSVPKRITNDWKTIAISEDMYLSHSPSLPVGRAKDLNNQEWYLLGLAIQTNEGKDNPLTEIGNSDTDNVKELYKSWNGRWLLVGNNEIHCDCSGLLGCFYTSINEERWISSSLAVLAAIGGLAPRPESLKHKSDFEWYPLPQSRFEGVCKLLPSQILDLRTFKPVQRQLPQPIKGLSYDEILEKLVEKFKLSLLNVSRLNKRIFLPLTAGYDSRLVLAATRYAGIEAETYTAGQPNLSYADLKLPYKMSKKSGYRHLFIKMQEASFSKEKEQLYDYHTGGNVDDIDRKRFAHGQWDVFGEGDLILRGGVFEIARCFYWHKMDGKFSIENILKTPNRTYNPNSFRAKTLEEWVEWVNRTPTQGLDWRDRYYLEQRVAGWLSSIEQSLDLTNTERFYIVNCHDIISLMLTIPVDKRKTSEHHIDLIKRMYPALLEFPFNPRDPIIKRLKKKVIKVSKMPLTEILKKLRSRVSS